MNLNRTIRYQSQLLIRRSFKPKRPFRMSITPKLYVVFRPAKRFGVKPQLAVFADPQVAEAD